MKAILLGSLGVLADLSALRREAFRRAFRESGLNFGSDDHAQTAQGFVPRAHTDPTADHTVAIGRLLALRTEHLRTALRDAKLPLRSGIARLIWNATSQNVPLGLVTTTSGPLMVDVFNAIDLRPETFDAIISADHVAAPKPAADCYHLAAAMLATAPENCVAIEDTLGGVAAARTARMEVLDLTGPRLSQDDPFAGLFARQNAHFPADAR